MTPLTVDPATFRKYLGVFTFEAFGDSRERRSGRLIGSRFPNCERFWRYFVVPLTERVAAYPKINWEAIGFLPSVNTRLEAIAMVHYSVFCHLAYAHECMDRVGTEKEAPSWIEDFYVHLAAACDLAEELIEKCYLLMLECQGKQSEVLQKLTREQYQDIAGEWYDKNYGQLFDHYLSKGRAPAIRVPSRKHLLREFLWSHQQQEPLYKDYVNFTQLLRTFRNHIVHSILLGKLQVEGNVLIPRAEVLNQYKRWGALRSALVDKERQVQDFVQPTEQGKQDLGLLEEHLNRLWQVLIDELESEFFSEVRLALRDLYGILFAPSASAVTRDALGWPMETDSSEWSAPAAPISNPNADPITTSGSAIWSPERLSSSDDAHG